jgi:predicted acylesterase/phospholipase RssA
MTTGQAATPDGADFGREIRIGLVMYGGVSLAIYINGVAREFFEAVRGRGVYALLKHLCDSDIVVDIVSGASAGGINGVFLAYALANQRDFSKLADLWRDQADIDDLLRPVSTRRPESLFDAERYYQRRLEEAFAAVRTSEDRAGVAPSHVEAIDLFVVGTDYHGVRTFRPDGLGHALSAKSYRSVFRLRHRSGRKGSDLVADDSPHPPETFDRALASVCRITSAFPAALSPVHVPGEGAGGADEAWSTHVRRWGDLGRASYFIDGGVLDNKPFTDVIERIYYRTAVRPVDRKIFYVEPDPEEFAQVGDEIERPTFTGVITSSLLAIPRYESIAADLVAIAARNASLARYQEIARQVLASGAPAGSDDAQRACRARQFMEPFRERVGVRRELPRTSAQQARALAAVQDDRNLVDRAAGTLADPPERALLQRHDVERSIRRHFFVSYQLRDALYGQPRPSEEDLRIGKNLRHALTRHIQIVKLVAAIVEDFQDRYTEACVAAAGGDPDALLSAIVERLDRLFAIGDLPGDPARWSGALSPAFPAPGAGAWTKYLPDTSIDIVKGALAGVGGRCARLATLPAAPGPTLLEHIEQRTRALLDHFAAASRPGTPCTVARDRWNGFDAIDRQLFPLEYLGGLREKDRIETIRVSPRDAQLGFSTRSARDKVAGDALGHFGGFLKRSWRANDILWGRLDARCILIQALLRADRVENATQSPEQRQRIRAVLGAPDAAVARLLPDASEADRQAIAGWLSALLGDSDGEHAKAIAGMDPVAPASIVLPLVRAAQTSILVEDLPDAAAAAGGRQPASRSPADLAAHFTSSYRVGSETPLEDIDTRALLKTASHTGLVARNALFGSILAGAPLRGRVLDPLKKLLGAPLWLTYWFATLVRLREIRVAVVLASMVALIVAIGWPVVLRGPGEPAQAAVSFTWVTVFILVPAGLLLLELLVFVLRFRFVGVLVLLLLVGVAAWLILGGPIELRSPILWR